MSALSAVLCYLVSNSGLLFFQVGQTAGTAEWRTWFTQYGTSDVAENFGSFLVRSCTGQGNDLKLIPTVKMENRHPVDGSFGSEFPSIYDP